MTAPDVAIMIASSSRGAVHVETPGSGACAYALGRLCRTGGAGGGEQRLPPGLYMGDYTCPQGLTALRLAVEDAGGRRIGVFDFGGNGDLPIGAYTVRITRNRYGKRLPDAAALDSPPGRLRDGRGPAATARATG